MSLHTVAEQRDLEERGETKNEGGGAAAWWRENASRAIQRPPATEEIPLELSLPKRRGFCWWLRCVGHLFIGTYWVAWLPISYALGETDYDFAVTLYSFAAMHATFLILLWHKVCFGGCRLTEWDAVWGFLAIVFLLLASTVELLLAHSILEECLEEPDAETRTLCGRHFTIALIASGLPLWGWLFSFMNLHSFHEENK